MSIWDVIHDRELGGNPMPEDEARCVGCGFEGTKKQVKDGLCAYCVIQITVSLITVTMFAVLNARPMVALAGLSKMAKVNG